ncbi:MAG TPA: SRPBCC family protein [Cyclobacteriaceae bacterium]
METKINFTATKTVAIKAPISKVWEALTKPKLIKKYFFGTDASTDWKKGSPIFFRGEWEGKPYEDKGFILDVVPGKMVKYSYWSSFSGTQDIPENYANVTYELSPNDDGGTILTITQDGLDSEERKRHSESNWGMIMENLKKLIE